MFEDTEGQAAVELYRKTYPPHEFGMRKIECLHEAGQAGTRYGFKLLTEVSKKISSADKANVVVLGYGNVAMGAINECYDQGVREVHILGHFNTRKDRIEKWLKHADIIINGAEQAIELRGKNYLITKKHVKLVLQPGSVVIDLIGGSLTNRSPIENVLECTYLNDPHFVVDDVYLSSLWGWPMMGMMRETAIRYSGQITDVLLGNESLIKGLSNLSPGVKKAVVCGPFYHEAI